MYTLSVQRDFIAQHYLIGGDFGAENALHSHPYQVEVRLTGETLDEHGYIVDIVDVENVLDQVIQIFSDVTLNDLPEFEGVNPSLEHFARIFHTKFVAGLDAGDLTKIQIKLWEDTNTWVEYSQK